MSFLDLADPGFLLGSSLRILIPPDPCGRHIFWLPTLSPDGKRLLHVHTDLQGKTEGKPWTELWVADINGQNAQKVRRSVLFFADRNDRLVGRRAVPPDEV